MSTQEIDAGKPWLVGGGFAAPVSYGELVAVAESELGESAGALPQCVGDVLIALLQGMFQGRVVQLREPAFAGEGGPNSTGMIRRAANHATIDRGVFASRLLNNSACRVVLESSGTAGNVTAVTHTVQSLGRAVVTHQRHRADVWGLAFNPSHIAGVQVLLQAVANGNTIVNLWGVEPVEVVARCRRWGVTHLSATPTFYRLLAAGGGTMPAIRSITVGGEVADERLVSRLQQVFPSARVHNIYASTEAGTLLVSDGAEFTLGDAETGKIRVDQGRLWIHRSRLGVFVGATEWYDTGDQVEVTADHPLRFRIVGRLRNAINVGGEKVNPHEIESALAEHPGVVAARVFGRRNSVIGEMLAAELVVGEPSPSERELRNHLARHFPAWKIPRLFHYVERLTLTRSGKVPRSGPAPVG